LSFISSVIPDLEKIETISPCGFFQVFFPSRTPNREDIIWNLLEARRPLEIVQMDFLVVISELGRMTIKRQ